LVSVFFAGGGLREINFKKALLGENLPVAAHFLAVETASHAHAMLSSQ